VFLSHASEDKSFVRQFATDLKANGVTVWLDEEQMVAGDSLVHGLSDGLRSADHVLLFVSTAFFRSSWTTIEANAALRSAFEHRKTTVIPLLLEDVWNKVPPLLSDILYVDFRDAASIPAYRRALQQVLRAVFRTPAAPLPPLARSPVILVSGGRRETGGRRGLKIALKLGRLLAGRSCQLLSGVAEGIDTEFGRGVSEGAKERRQDVRTMLTAYADRGAEARHDFGRILQSKQHSRREGIPELVEQADVAFLIGGGKNTMFLGILMLLEGKVVFPVASTGGAAQDCHTLILRRYDQTFRGTVPRARFEDLGDRNLGSSGMADVCVELLDLLLGRSTGRDLTSARRPAGAGTRRPRSRPGTTRSTG
jgi:hypothetical protein